eukprot:CCRYP_015930-RF/>CCRYP_015930-RF protein AED:0.50 eAED:0.50 QI:0/-1/0/1/-1/0/1/0/6
MNPCLS